MTAKKRGRYEKQQPGSDVVADQPWSEEDQAHYAALFAASPLAVEAAKAGLCSRAVELSRACRSLDARVRTSDEERALGTASTQYRKTLEALKVSSRVVEEGDEL